MMAAPKPRNKAVTPNKTADDRRHPAHALGPSGVWGADDTPSPADLHDDGPTGTEAADGTAQG